MERDAVVIEVGLNEATECAAAGAALVHWHARDPVAGVQRLSDTALHAQALAPMRAHTPTAPRF